MAEIKFAIDALAKLINYHGFSYVPAEAFRQAKFDKDYPCQLLWNLLAELLIAMKYNWRLCQKEIEELNKDDEKLMKFVKNRLFTEGYLLKNITSMSGSRTLLIAFAWLLAQTHFIDRLMSISMKQTTNQWEKKLLENLDISCITRVNKSNVKPAENIPQLCDHLTWLIGKNKISRRNLHDVYEEELKLMNKISLMPEVEMSSHCFLSPKLELLLIMQPKLQKQFIKMVKEETVICNLFLKWKENESLFWKWMLSVTALYEPKESPISQFKEDLEEMNYPKHKENTENYLKELNFMQLETKTKTLKPINELNDELTQQKFDLEMEINEKRQRNHQKLTQLCSRLEGVICIPPS